MSLLTQLAIALRVPYLEKHKKGYYSAISFGSPSVLGTDSGSGTLGDRCRDSEARICAVPSFPVTCRGREGNSRVASVVLRL